jgi:hypothetical protein
MLVLLIAFATPSAAAYANDTEDKLYQSCLIGSVNRSNVEKTCKCQARKWAAGKIPDSQNPSQFLEIKKEYIDHLLTRWDYKLESANEKKLAGTEAEMVAIAIKISFICVTESDE